MAARRAAAKAAAAAAAAAEPPPPPAEPTPEPEPETKDPEPADKPTNVEDNPPGSKSKDSLLKKDGKVTERIIERIIICPGGQNPYMNQPSFPPSQYPPQTQGRCLCNPQQTASKKKRKGKKKAADEDELCNHPYCIVQRAKVKPQGLPWASGLWPGPNPSPKPPVVICQRPVLCCCRKCSKDSDSSEDSSCEEEDSPQKDTETYMTFMNMVFAAANVMNERRDVF